MTITINNTSINSRLTVIFDAAGSLSGDGPALGTGNTESDVYIDSKVYLNIRSHTEVPSTVHAIQCWNKGGTWTYELEHTNDDPNTTYATQSDLPQWVSNVVIRCEAQDKYDEAYSTAYNADSSANSEDDSAAVTAGTNAGTTARNDYLTANSITF
jgi:cation transport regulator ChaB|tara:strand:+ start:2418 stop:2885 length:468 start_codon:yes stop_codon:yes gene_type:complete